MLSKKSLERIWQIYGLGIVAYAALGSLAFYFMNDSSISITTNYWTNNDLASQSKTIFASASSNLWQVQYKDLLITLLVLSLIVPAIYINQIISKKKKIDLRSFRWIDWLVTSSVILAIIAIASSLQDLMTIVLIIGVSVVAYILHKLALNTHNLNPQLSKTIYRLEIFTLILPWLLILFYAVGTIVYGSVRSPWYVYALYLVGLISLAGLIYEHAWQQKTIGKEKNLTTEISPIIFSQIIKVAFSLILIIGLWK